jgi:general stress protein 26
MDTKTKEKLTEMIKDIGVAMMTTVASDGTLHSRPMACPKHGYDGDLWFFTSDDAPKVLELADSTRTNVTFAEPKHERYISISGRLMLVHDPNRVKEMWNPLLKGWFPEGLKDPHLALLRVAVEQVEYWDAKQSRMLVFFSLVKSALTGRPPRYLGEHERVG